MIFPVLLVLTLILAACGNETIDEPKQPVTEENGSSDNTGSTDNVEDESTGATENTGSTENADNMYEKMKELDYSDFELAVEYSNDLDYEVELEKSSNNTVKSEIDDDVNNVKKSGVEAFDESYPLVKELTITQETSKDDAIQEVLNTFNLPDDYQKFELEIKFNDGKKVEFEDVK